MTRWNFAWRVRLPTLGLLVLTIAAVPGVASAKYPSVGANVIPVDSGGLVLVEPDDRTRELINGRSATEFSFRLPDGAACPGDSLHDQWRIQSFVVPIADDVSTLDYGVIGPQGPEQYALYSLDTRPFTDRLTRQNLGSGEPGVIAEVPAFSFSIFPPGTLSSGRYRIGIACTYFRATANYWSVELIVEETLDDSPGQMTWRLAGAPEVSTPDEKNSQLGRVVVAGVLGVLVAALFLARQRRGSRRAGSADGTTSTKEQQ